MWRGSRLCLACVDGLLMRRSPCCLLTVTLTCCCASRWCCHQFVSRYISTIGVDFGVKPVVVNGTSVKVNFWDLSGHPEFFEIRNEFYKNAQGAVLVFDATSRRSFENLGNWLEEARKYGAPDHTVFVCCNKTDKKRLVSTTEGRNWADEHGLRCVMSLSGSCTGARRACARTVVVCDARVTGARACLGAD